MDPLLKPQNNICPLRLMIVAAILHNDSNFPFSDSFCLITYFRGRKALLTPSLHYNCFEKMRTLYKILSLLDVLFLICLPYLFMLKIEKRCLQGILALMFLEIAAVIFLLAFYTRNYVKKPL